MECYTFSKYTKHLAEEREQITCYFQVNGSYKYDFPCFNETLYTTKSLVFPYSTVIKHFKTLFKHV